jgi:hypothetical protein
VRVTIEGCGLTVCSPSSMRNTSMCHELPVHIDVLLIDQFPQSRDLADLLEKVDFVLAIAIDGHTGRVISTVFETLEA